MASNLIIIFLLISVSSPAVWITKINKCISEPFYFYLIFHTNWATALCCDWRLVWGGFLLVTCYIPSNIAHGIVRVAPHLSLLSWLHVVVVLVMLVRVYRKYTFII